MTSFEPVQAGPYLLPSDPPNLAQISKDISDWAAPRLNMRFATTAARDAAIPIPVEGMECVTDTGAAMVKWLYFNAAWRGVTVPTAWTAVTFQNSWVNFDATRPCQYRKVGDRGFLRGAAKSGTSPQVIFTLPSGFWPIQSEDFAVAANNLFGVVRVFSDGAVYSAVGGNTKVDLAGIQFSTIT